ncbi:MAG: GxxExxY protein [Armatimonadetes bacterium]|jgi:GxxExxY protein|nr:GxxExxY protein [Armatimonadota bacterium]
MHADEERRDISSITHRVIGCAFNVANELGTGFLEKVYENALAHELRKAGLAVAQQEPVTVRCDGVVVGEFVVDLLVEGCILVELKAIRGLDEVHTAQGLNYLKATGFQICLLINFGSKKVEIRRLVRDL